MTDKPMPIVDFLLQDRQDAPTLRATGAITETIDLDWIRSDDPESPAANRTQDIKSTAVGRLLQIVPIPTLLVDRSGTVILANRACTESRGGQNGFDGEHVSRFFARDSLVDPASILVEEVFATRKPGVCEGEFEVNGVNINGRLHARPIRAAGQTYVLIMVVPLVGDRSAPSSDDKVDPRPKPATDKRRRGPGP